MLSLQSVEKRNSPVLTIVLIKKIMNFTGEKVVRGKKSFKVREKSEFFILSQGKIEIT